MAEPDMTTTEDLRNRMFEVLKKRGMVDVLKTQLRSQLVGELQKIGLSQSFHVRESGDNELEDSASGQQLCQHAANSLVADHLRRSNFSYTLSIFQPESGINTQSVLSVSDILKLLRISSQSRLYEKIMKNSCSSGLLWKLISEISAVHGCPTVDNGTQTDVSKYNAITSLEEQFAKVDAHYGSTQDMQLLRLGAVEERILTYQRQLEERSQAELRMSLARFRENELAQMRIMEREQCRKEMDKSRREMEQNYQVKFDALRERERHAVEQLQRQQEIVEKEMFSQRQSLLGEIDALKQRDLQIRRQQDIDNRERQLYEDKVKTREELARHREENARRIEVEYEHRIRDEVEKFKLEERTRYIDRLSAVELREAKVKENERKLDDQLQDVSDVKIELKEKRSRVSELEAELIRTRHELVSVQKQFDLLNEKAREMVDYQILKEDNAVLRRELDSSKMRMAELQRDNLVERQKQEELLREMAQQYAKPMPEVSLLRQQIDQIQSRHRTELAIVEQERLVLQQRLQDEIARNKELVMKCEEQTWHQKQIGLEAADLRERLLDSHHALTAPLHRRYTDLLDRSGSLCDCSDIICSEPECGLADSKQQHTVNGVVKARPSDDQSFSSDLVQDTKNRLKKLESEAEMLEKNYRDFQFRVTNLDPFLDPNPQPCEKPKITVRSETELRKKEDAKHVQPITDRDKLPSYSHGLLSEVNRSDAVELNIQPYQHSRTTDTTHLVSAYNQPNSSHAVLQPVAFEDDHPVDESPANSEHVISSDSSQPRSSLGSRHSDTAVQPVAALQHISLDDAWRTSTIGPKSESDSDHERSRTEAAAKEELERRNKLQKDMEEEARLKKQQEHERMMKQAAEEEERRRLEAEEELENRRRIQREEERKRLQEEARLREQQELERLQKQEASERKEANARGQGDEDRKHIGEEGEIKERQELEKAPKQKIESPEPSEDDEVSLSAPVSERSAASEKDDFW